MMLMLTIPCNSQTRKMRVISTDPGALLPAKDGQAEILDSSLTTFSSLTICVRFLTFTFSVYPDEWPIQTLISYDGGGLLNSYIAIPCDEAYPGCTEEYQDILATIDIQWIRGQSYGYDFSDLTYPVWWPAVWNSACISAIPGQGYFRLNINGHTAFQTNNQDHTLFKNHKV